MRGGISRVHPAVSLLYYTAVIVFSVFIMHPVCLVISLVCAAADAVTLNGKKAIGFGLKIVLPTAVFIILINPVVNHRGVTVLRYLPWNNPLTLESIFFGVASALMLAGVVLRFSAFHTVMTSDKLVFLFGRTLPSLGLVLSMALRFVPRFTAELRDVRTAQRMLYPMKNGVFERLKSAARVLSVMTSKALEDSIETADSMKARGWGLKGRTAFSRYRVSKEDIVLLALIVILSALVAVFMICGTARFRYFPAVSEIGTGADSMLFYGSYAALLLLPVILNAWEELMWRRSVSKI